MMIVYMESLVEDIAISYNLISLIQNLIQFFLFSITAPSREGLHLGSAH